MLTLTAALLLCAIIADARTCPAALVADSVALPYSPGFDIKNVAGLSKSLASHSWEYGTASIALIDLYNPEISVFGANPFPVPTLPQNTSALAYALTNIVISSSPNVLAAGDGAVGDPASLGVAAVLLGKSSGIYAGAAWNQVNYLLNYAPKFYNGAISQRSSYPELWADNMFMTPPFIAYYAADSNDANMLQEAVNQCAYYRQVLQANISSSVSYKGLWQHISGPVTTDTGLWSTGNAWAAAGMARVLATVMKAPVASSASWSPTAISNLNTWIKEILDGAMNSPLDNGLLRNYLNDTSNDGHGFGEISGSSLLASVVYRMVVLSPKIFGSSYLQWAENIRRTLAGSDSNGQPHVTTTGISTPAVNPLGWKDTTPYTSGSPEGQSFVVLMYAAWRDCIQAGVCTETSVSSQRRRSLNLHSGLRLKRNL